MQEEFHPSGMKQRDVENPSCHKSSDPKREKVEEI